MATRKSWEENSQMASQKMSPNIHKMFQIVKNFSMCFRKQYIEFKLRKRKQLSVGDSNSENLDFNSYVHLSLLSLRKLLMPVALICASFFPKSRARTRSR